MPQNQEDPLIIGWCWRLGAILATLVAALTLALATAPTALGADPFSSCPAGPNQIACENSLPGDPPSDWQVNGNGDASIQGFATSMSVNAGQTVSFKIKTPASSYHINILRLGYYQGNGARMIAAGIKPTATLPQTQPACVIDSSATGLVDCGNWGVSASWTVPSDAVSGLYVADLIRDDTAGTSQIPFVVRNDASHSDLVVQTSDAAWEAYNTYGGNSLYSCTVSCPSGNPLAYTGAYKVSYNRPFTFTDDGGVASPYYAEYPMIRFLEANGYDVSYISESDTDGRGALLLNHKAFLSVGHDEYWSGQQRANVVAARDAGVSLAFFSGNEVFWKTRWEPSIDGSGTSYRTLVTYKETHFASPVDPKDPPTWTGAWGDPRFSPPADGGGVPANALTGQVFNVNSGSASITVPATYAALRFWRNTAVANLPPGGSVTLAPQSLGYEWDLDADNGFRPAGEFHLSSTTVSGLQLFTDYGSTVLNNGTATHNLTLYRAPSSALVFGAGTVQWTWGLDANNPNNDKPDVNMQQATVNLLADMGAQPQALLSGLTRATPSSDTTPPTSVITSPASGANLADASQTTVTGTATDSGGGVVAGVEISTDAGNTWHPATITGAAARTVSWSYSWVVRGAPSATIESRAVDDSGNLETPTDATPVNVACPCSIWGTSVTPPNPDSGDPSPVEVGMQVTSDTFGTISGLRFYKVTANTGTHVGSLWTASGQLLARATFASETSSGWQTVTFSAPVPINPNTTYVVSYFAPNGHYAQTEGYFYPGPAPNQLGGAVTDSAPLHALHNTGSTGNGVFVYGSAPSFPAGTFNSENYWVDPIFSPAPAPGQATGVTANAGYASAALTWNAPSTGGPVTAYVVTPYIGATAQPSTTVTGSPAPTSTTLTGLANGTAYTFTVQATNPAGGGTPSAPSNSVTPLATLSAISNGGFESGFSYWSSGGVAAPTVSTAKAHSGSASGLLGTLSGSEPGGDSWVSQTVTVPANAKLTFWYWPATTDTPCSGSACIYDWEEAQVRSTSGATLASVFKTNSNAQAWTQVSYDMSANAGQTVVLWFNVHQDAGGDPSYMYVDDVALNGAGVSVPAAPTNVTAAAGNGQATVSWNAPPNGGSPITSYTITPYVGITAQSPTTITGSPPGTSATITGLTNGLTYTFAVTATNSVGSGALSTASNAVTPAAPTVPASPTSVTAVAGNGLATVSWSAPANGGSPITSYTITLYVGGTSQTPTTITGSPPATNATITGLTNGTSYTFTVTAANSVGPGLPSSASTAVTPGAPPGAPTAVTAAAGNGQATVSWSAPADGGSPIRSYTVTPYIGTTAQVPTTISGSPPATSATITGLVNGTAYTFTVNATNAVSAGPASSPSGAVTPLGPPGAPTHVTAVGGNTQATVSWTAPANGGSPITSYTITPSVGLTAQSATTITGSPPATSATITGLTNGTTYTFMVLATNGVAPGPASAASNAVAPSASIIPSFVQQVAGHVANATSLAANPASSVTAGDRLVVVAGVWSNGGATAQGVTDSAGNTYTEVLHFKASEKTEMSVWTAPITSGGGTRPTVTVTPAARADVGLGVLEYSGLSSASGTAAIDQSAQKTATTGGASTVSSGATPATTADNELAMGFYVDSGFGDTLTAGSGWTQRTNISNAGDIELLAEDQIVAQGATPNAGVGTGASTTWLVATVVFKHS